uniref:E5 n=1 Tax=Heterorhabditis bacteriophora TaxID=37862 RepID=A0A1I7W6Q1_HETBA
MYIVLILTIAVAGCIFLCCFILFIFCTTCWLTSCWFVYLVL